MGTVVGHTHDGTSAWADRKNFVQVYGPNWRVPQGQNQTDTYRKQTHVMGPDACTKYFLEANGNVKEQKKARGILQP